MKKISNYISKTSIVRDSKVGSDTKIWEYCNIYECVIGNNCNIGSYVEIQSGVNIGNNVTISSHSFVCSMVEICDDVFIGHGVMTINDIHPPSFKRTGSKSQWRKTLIKKGAIIGSNVTLMPIEIGKNSQIGAGSVVTKNIPDNCIAYGNPAKIIRKL